MGVTSLAQRCYSKTYPWQPCEGGRGQGTPRAPRRRGSRASRRPSPARLNASTVSVIAMPAYCQERQPEDGHGEPDGCEQDDGPVHPGVGLPGGEHAQRHAHDDREHLADYGYDNSGRHALPDDLGYGDALAHRLAQVAARQLAHPGEELHVDRFIEVQGRPYRPQLLRRRLIPGYHLGRVAGGEPKQPEHEDYDEDEYRYGRQQPRRFSTIPNPHRTRAMRWR